MGPPETPAQCLCPLSPGRDGSSSKDSSKTIKERKVHDAHAIGVDDSKSLTGHCSSSNKDTPTDNIRRSLSPISLFSWSFPPLLRRSASVTTFYNGGDAQQCIIACRQGFFDSLSSSSPSSPPLNDTCSLLSINTAAQQELWQLYWCDSAFCGVWIDTGGGTGQDRKWYG